MAVRVAGPLNRALVNAEYQLIDRQNYGTIKNLNAGRSALDHLVEYGKELSGAFRIVQTWEKTAKVAAMVFAEFSSALSPFFEDLSNRIGAALKWFAVPRLAGLTKNAWKAVTTWGGSLRGPQYTERRGHTKNIHDVAEWAASLGYVASVVFNSTPIKNMADIPNLVVDVTDLAQAGEDYWITGHHLRQVEEVHPVLKARFAATQQEALIRIIKTVTSLASGVFGILALVLGKPLVPAVVLLGLSVTSMLSAMWAHFFKETRVCEMVKLCEGRDPVVLQINQERINVI